jgi:signal transduction histidine kinase
MDLEDAFAHEAAVAPAARTRDQAGFLTSSVAQFWDAVDRVFALAARDEAAAREQVRLSLQARQAALSTAVSRLLVENNEGEEQAATRTQQIHRQVEWNLYLFLGAMLLLLAAVSWHLMRYHRRIFDRVSSLSTLRSELAQQLILTQENTLRSISRELHDDFGQILTAIGTMLQRANKLTPPLQDGLREELREIHAVVQSTLEKVRSLSQALHPVMLEEVGFESAIDTYIPVFERRTGIAVRYLKTGESREISRETSIHLYRVLQEALNNVARHSGSKQAEVRLDCAPTRVTLAVEDGGRGFGDSQRSGLGLISMRERAELAGGEIEFLPGAAGGALVRISVPLVEQEAHATARS